MGSLRHRWTSHAGTHWTNIWRVNADGSGLAKLTSGKADVAPVCSPDHTWVYYVDFSGNPGKIWRVRADGSEKPEMIAPKPNFPGYFAGSFDISADGKTLVYLVQMIDVQTGNATTNDPNV